MSVGDALPSNYLGDENSHAHCQLKFKENFWLEASTTGCLYDLMYVYDLY
tara:strand:+ start:300 stop:449 length:150 start_codon:yes stop_codon:yes gene_type:complete